MAYELKETEEGIQYIREVMDRIYSEGEKMGMKVEQIILAVMASESEVRKWLD